MFYPNVSKATKAIWFLKCPDKRWNDSGPFIYKGMRGMPFEVSIRIEELKLKFGEPPEDMEWGYTLSTYKYYWAKVKNLFRFLKG